MISNSLTIHLVIIGILCSYCALGDQTFFEVEGGTDFGTKDDFIADPVEDPSVIRFNKFNPIDQAYGDLPLNSSHYPISEKDEVVTYLKKETDAESVVNDKNDDEIIYNIEELIKLVGDLPDHPSSNMKADYWKKFDKVITLRSMGGKAKAKGALRKYMQLPSKWERFTVEGVAQAVYDEYPGSHQADFLADLVGGKYGPIEYDSAIIPTRSESQFLREVVTLAYINTWSIALVGPHNFGAKWFGGRARPEEIAWLIKNGQVQAPKKIKKRISEIPDFNKATDFTRYRGRNARLGREGSPRHPSWPAMHSAGSNMSFWLQIIMNLTPKQLCEAKKVDFAVSFARTVAGVHFEDDNMAGLKMGQEIVARALPAHFAKKYKGDANVIQQKVEEKRFAWDAYDALEKCGPGGPGGPGRPPSSRPPSNRPPSNRPPSNKPPSRRPPSRGPGGKPGN